MPDDDHEHEPRAFAFPVPAEIVAALHAQHHAHHDRVEMAADDRENRLFTFLDSLTVEQMMTMRMLANVDRDSSFWQYVDGLCTGWLKLKHNVDPTTGKSYEEALLGAKKDDNDGPDRPQ